MAPLGPFEPRAHLAVAVSGGADSLACAILAQDWAAARHGKVTGLVVDHGLRAGSAAEARTTAARLQAAGIEAEILTLRGLAPGPALAERARRARHDALEAACAGRGILHLLLGHHAADQAETVALRQLDRSGPAGLAGMAALTERRHVRLLRPLLTIAPADLRAVLRARGLVWIDDPSNSDPHAGRNRLRLLRADADGTGPATRAAVAAAILRGHSRAHAETAAADWLGRFVHLHPEGYALMPRTPPRPLALAHLLRALTGSAYNPATAAVAAWCADPRPATLAGIRILPAGRLAADAWLLVREAAAMAPARTCHPGTTWDRRFRIVAAPNFPSSLTIGPLGAEAPLLRDHAHLPSAVLQTLPALRRDGRLFAVPHLGYCDHDDFPTGRPPWQILFDPATAAAGAAFFAPEPGDLREGFA